MLTRPSPILETGFILKRFLPQKQKFSVLTRSRGRITLTSIPIQRGESLWPGMLIGYKPERELGSVLLARDIEILVSPPNEEARDIYWIHCLLEMCYYLSPQHDPHSRLYNALSLGIFALTKHKSSLQTSLQGLELSILQLFFTELGFYAKTERVHTQALFENILSSYVDMEPEQALESLICYSKEVYSQERKAVLLSLITSLQNHPHSQRLKNVWRLIDHYSKGLP